MIPKFTQIERGIIYVAFGSLLQILTTYCMINGENEFLAKIGNSSFYAMWIIYTFGFGLIICKSKRDLNILISMSFIFIILMNAGAVLLGLGDLYRILFI